MLFNNLISICIRNKKSPYYQHPCLNEEDKNLLCVFKVEKFLFWLWTTFFPPLLPSFSSFFFRTDNISICLKVMGLQCHALPWPSIKVFDLLKVLHLRLVCFQPVLQPLAIPMAIAPHNVRRLRWGFYRGQHRLQTATTASGTRNIFPFLIPFFLYLIAKGNLGFPLWKVGFLCWKPKKRRKTEGTS